MDALTRREAYDELLDEVHALDLNPADPEGVAAAVHDALPKLLDAAEQLSPSSPVLAAELRYQAANLLLILGQATKAPEHLERAKHFAEQGLQAIEGQQARLLEAMLRYVRAGALTLQGQLAPAHADLAAVIAVLEPHVTEMRRVRASGNMAEQFAVELLDRRVQAESLLVEARVAATELGGVVGAIRAGSSALDTTDSRSEAVRAAERTNEREARTNTPRSRITEAAVITVLGAAGLWYFDSLIARVLIAAVVLFSVTTTVLFLRRRPAS